MPIHQPKSDGRPVSPMPLLRLVAVLAMLQGCAGPQAKHIPLQDADSARDGLVYASIAVQAKSPLAYESLQIRPLGQGELLEAEDIKIRVHDWRETFKFDQGDHYTPHFKGVDETGFVYAASLPPGDYEIFSLHWKWQRYTSQKPYFSIPFHVTAGQATYLGRFVGEAVFPQASAHGSLMVDSTNFLGARIRFRSDFSRDTEMLHDHFPSTARFKPVAAAIQPCIVFSCQ